MDYSFDTFGNTVSLNIYREIFSRIAALETMPDANPKYTRIVSAPNETYRKILIKSFIVLYVVTPKTIEIIDIFHSSMDYKLK